MFLHLDYLDSCSTKLRHYINDFRYKNLVDINLLTDDIKGNKQRETSILMLPLSISQIQAFPNVHFLFPPVCFFFSDVSRPCCPWSCGSWQSELPPEDLSGTGSHG